MEGTKVSSIGRGKGTGTGMREEDKNVIGKC